MATILVAGPASEYRELASQVRDAGLLDHRPGSSLARMAVVTLALAASWAALFAVGDSWASLGIAALLAFLSTQVVFFGHDAGHQQIFTSCQANRTVGFVVATC